MGQLSDLQSRVLAVLADIEPQWTLTGGAALVGFHLGHRTTRPHEVLVNKLCALLHRSELSDLVDIQALLQDGGDLDRALSDAPRKDGGFSALTLGWTLQGWNVAEVAREAGLEQRADELDRFRTHLLAKVAGERP